MSLTPHELERYARHIMLREVGGPGQQKLKEASVALIGAGALGGPSRRSKCCICNGNCRN